VVKSKNLFIINVEIHSQNTRQVNNFYLPITDLTVYQKGVYYMGIKVFNNQSPHIKDTSNNV
jgi:hypothetical protein